MRKNPKLLLIVGVLLLLAGFALDFGSGGEAQATAQQEQLCRTEMARRGPGAAELAEKCSEANFAIAIAASSVGSSVSADEAAAAISGNNQTEVGGSTLSKFLMGLGIGLLIAGIIALVMRRREG